MRVTLHIWCQSGHGPSEHLLASGQDQVLTVAQPLSPFFVAVLAVVELVAGLRCRDSLSSSLSTAFLSLDTLRVRYTLFVSSSDHISNNFISLILTHFLPNSLRFVVFNSSIPAYSLSVGPVVHGSSRTSRLASS